MYDDAPFNKAKTFAILRERGITVAEVYYSGGHDEGGVNEILLYDAANEASKLPIWHGGGYMSQPDGSWRQTDPPVGSDQELAQQLAAPVDDEYGSWAGEFYVEGKLVFDVASGTVKSSESAETSYSVDRGWAV